MTKNLLLLCMLALVACGKGLAPGRVKPGVRTSGPRMIMVEQPWVLTVFLYGDFPQGKMGIEVSAGDRNIQVPFSRGIVDTGDSRVYNYKLKFTHSFYYRLWYAHGDGLLGWGRLFSESDASCMGESCPWDEWVVVVVRIRKLDIMPGGELQMGKDYAHEQHRVKLGCWDCAPERAR